MKNTKLSVTACLALVVISVYSCAKAGIGGPSFTVDGVATGTQVVPNSASSASGLIVGNFDGGINTLKATIKWGSLSGSPTAIHIHAGSPGRNGFPYFVLKNIPKGATDSLNFTSAFTESLEGSVRGGGYYFDIHTAAYPEGEIRGQIIGH